MLGIEIHYKRERTLESSYCVELYFRLNQMRQSTCLVVLHVGDIQLMDSINLSVLHNSVNYNELGAVDTRKTGHKAENSCVNYSIKPKINTSQIEILLLHLNFVIQPSTIAQEVVSSVTSNFVTKKLSRGDTTVNRGVTEVIPDGNSNMFFIVEIH